MGGVGARSGVFLGGFSPHTVKNIKAPRRRQKKLKGLIRLRIFISAIIAD
jgi:hypothetical protein